MGTVWELLFYEKALWSLSFCSFSICIFIWIDQRQCVFPVHWHKVQQRGQDRYQTGDLATQNSVWHIINISTTQGIDEQTLALVFSACWQEDVWLLSNFSPWMFNSLTIPVAFKCSIKNKKKEKSSAVVCDLKAPFKSTEMILFSILGEKVQDCQSNI